MPVEEYAVTATEFFTEHVVSCICAFVSFRWVVFARVPPLHFLPYFLELLPCFLADDTTLSTYPANEWNVVFGPRYKQGQATACDNLGCIDATIHRGKSQLHDL